LLYSLSLTPHLRSEKLPCPLLEKATAPVGLEPSGVFTLAVQVVLPPQTHGGGVALEQSL